MYEDGTNKHTKAAQTNLRRRHKQTHEGGANKPCNFVET
jgi:hypothetical protein